MYKLKIIQKGKRYLISRHSLFMSLSSWIHIQRTNKSAEVWANRKAVMRLKFKTCGTD